MKKIYLILFAIATLSACKKDNTDKACISQTTAIPQVSTADNTTALALLQSNNISSANLVVYNANFNYTLNGSDSKYSSLYASQVFNGLPLLLGDMNYQFQDGVLQSTNGIRVNSISLDTKSTQKLPALRNFYLAEVINKQGYTNTFKDSCLVVQFGYFNIGDTPTPDIVKAWKVKPAHSNFPSAIFRDDNGNTLNFESGFVFF